MKHSALILTVLLILSGCVKGKTVRLGPTEAGTFDTVEPDSVMVVETVEDISGAYVKVGRITTKGGWATTGIGKHAKKMRQKGSKLGADCVVLQGLEDPGTAAKIFGVGSKKGAALAVRLIDTDEERAIAEEKNLEVISEDETDGQQ